MMSNMIYLILYTRIKRDEQDAAKICLLRSLSFSYQKKDWRAGPRLSLWYDPRPQFVIRSLHTLYCVADVIPKEGLALPCVPIVFMV